MPENPLLLYLRKGKRKVKVFRKKGWGLGRVGFKKGKNIVGLRFEKKTKRQDSRMRQEKHEGTNVCNSLTSKGFFFLEPLKLAEFKHPQDSKSLCNVVLV